MLGVIYYVVALGALIVYFACLKKFRLKIITFSTSSYLLAMFLAIIPGYQISRGEFYDSRFSHGLDVDVYLLYLLFSVLFPAGLAFGQLAGKNHFVFARERSKYGRRINITLAFIAVYSILYFIWIPVML